LKKSKQLSSSPSLDVVVQIPVGDVRNNPGISSMTQDAGGPPPDTERRVKISSEQEIRDERS
jgi:hypothetical protein